MEVMDEHQGIIRISSQYEKYIDEVLLKFQYTHSHVKLQTTKGGLTYRTHSAASDIEKEIAYLLYRAKIRDDGATQRKTLFRAVFGK